MLLPMNKWLVQWLIFYRGLDGTNKLLVTNNIERETIVKTLIDWSYYNDCEKEGN
jgi:hypothetical protein